MPLTHIQPEVLRTVAANRRPESYLVGLTVLHRAQRLAQGSVESLSMRL